MAPAKLSKACFCCFFRPRATPPSMSTSAPLPPNDSASFMNELQSALHHRSHETSTGATSPRVFQESSIMFMNISKAVI